MQEKWTSVKSSSNFCLYFPANQLNFNKQIIVIVIAIADNILSSV